MLNDAIKEIFGQTVVENCVGCSLDSRQVKQGSLFVAYRGATLDGHDYIERAIEQGAVCVLGERDITHCKVPYIKVANVQKAITQLASCYRFQLSAKFIALTGSVGKTTTKNMLRVMLASSYKTHATEKNQNNEWGVPLTILNTRFDHDFVVIEVGARCQGDIKKLMPIINPHITIITRIADSHMASFGSLEVLAATKAEILQYCQEGDVAFLRQDEFDMFLWQSKRRLFTVHADINKPGGYTLLRSGQSYALQLNYHHTLVSMNLAIRHRHIAENAVMVASVGLFLGVTLKKIQTALNTMSETPGRMYHTQCDRYNLIDDTYNASPASTRAAIDALKAYDGKKMLLLGAMAELGDKAHQYHSEAIKYAQDSKIDCIITYGDAFLTIHGHNVYHELNIDQLHSLIADNSIKNILVKGSRAMKMERFVKDLASVVA